jgi:hypothetical protein
VKLREQLKELEKSLTSHREAAGATPGRAKDNSFGRLAEGGSRSSGDLCQASGEVHPEPSLGVHEVVLPQGSGRCSRGWTSHQLHR